jgi:hypothetical protein
MFLLFANYIAMRLGLLGTLAPPYGRRYSPSWKTNGFLNLSQAFTLPKSPLRTPEFAMRDQQCSSASMGPIKFHSGFLPFFDIQAR